MIQEPSIGVNFFINNDLYEIVRISLDNLDVIAKMITDDRLFTFSAAWVKIQLNQQNQGRQIADYLLGHNF